MNGFRCKLISNERYMSVYLVGVGGCQVSLIKGELGQVSSDGVCHVSRSGWTSVTHPRVTCGGHVGST